MAELTVQKVGLSGLNPAFVAADSAGDSFANEGRVFLHVKNGDTVDRIVTIDSVQSCNFGFDHDITVTVLAGEDSQIGPFSTIRFNNENRLVNVTYDAVISTTVAAIQI